MRFPKQQIITISCIIAGVFLICLGVILGWSTFPKIVQKTISENFKLDYGLKMFKIWLNPPVPLSFRAYIFNVSNPEEVSKGGKPILKQIGPYTFKKTIHRIHPMHFPDIDAIWYEERTHLEFDEKNSGPGLKANDEVTTIHVALMASIWFLEGLLGSDLLSMANPVLEEVFINYGLFQKGKVIDLIFQGYPIVNCTETEESSSLTATACEQISQNSPPNVWESSPNIFSFGFLKPLNSSSEPPSGIGHSPFLTAGETEEDENKIKELLKRTFLISKGANNISEFAHVREWAGKSKIEFWPGEECQIIQGGDSTVYAPLPEKKPLNIFIVNLCRSVMMYFKHELQFKGVTGYHFEMDPNVYNYSEGHNQCFCKENDLSKCPPNGTIDLTLCYDGHLIISYPHYLFGSLELQNYAEGIKPDLEKHKTFIEIDQFTGIALRGAKRYQFSVKMRPVNSIGPLENVTSGMFPVLWVEELFELDDIHLEDIKGMRLQITLLDWIKWILIVLGIILILVGFYLHWKRQKEEQHLTQLNRAKADVPKGAMQGEIHALGRISNVNQITPVDTILYPIRKNTKNIQDVNDGNGSNVEHSKLQD